MPEIFDALPTWRERIRFGAGQIARVARTRISPTRMAARMRIAKTVDFFEACKRITMPTLVVTGQPGLDRVVPVESTREYERYLPAARLVKLDNTGHIGSVTHADRFAELVAGFAEAHAGRDAVRRPA